MDNHPIPQDITGFKFKLFGPMTVKQFAYLAGNIIVAWVFYILPISVFIKVPFEIGFVLFGVGLAFVPIAGRPMDVMIKNFFIAIFSPTKYVYQKDIGPIVNQPASNVPSEKIDTHILNTASSPPITPDSIPVVASPQVQVNKPPAFVPMHSFPNQEPDNTPKPAAADVQKQPDIAKTNDQSTKANQDSETHQKVTELENNLSDTLLQKKQLEDRVIELQKKLQNQNPDSASQVEPKPDSPMPQSSIRSIPNSQAKSAGFPTPSEYPNVITGIIKDPRGNPLPNILVEVKDKEGNAVRAFKTNPLGQFASATPLVNGEYLIEFEDPKAQNKFDSVTFKAINEIILPIEVTSVDQREELRRSLFN